MNEGLAQASEHVALPARCVGNDHGDRCGGGVIPGPGAAGCGTDGCGHAGADAPTPAPAGYGTKGIGFHGSCHCLNAMACRDGWPPRDTARVPCPVPGQTRPAGAASLMARWSASTMAAGVFAGASTPHHVLTSKLAMPASAIVGTPGNSGERCALVTASTGSLPSRTNGRMVGTVEKNRSTRPDSNSTVAGLLPLNGTCVICKPAFWRNISPAR